MEPVPPRRRLLDRALAAIERAGNRLPDPALLFVAALALTWVLSALLSRVDLPVEDPRTGAPLVVHSQLTAPALARFLSTMVKTFTDFPPLGVVLVALLGVGVAEHTGFVGAGLKTLLAFTPGRLLTPALILVGILSHTAADAGFVLVIPLGGVIFRAAGRHPLAGIAAAFAGVSGGFGANFVPSAIDPLLQGFTQTAAQVVDPSRLVNPLCNWWFTASSGVLIVALGWFLTDRVVEPRLKATPVDGDPTDAPVERSTPAGGPPALAPLTAAERKGLVAGLTVVAVAGTGLFLWAWPTGSALRAPGGEVTTSSAPLMQSIIPLIFLFFLLPGIAYGVVAGTVSSHRDVVAGMSQAMSTMSYYLVLAFCAAQFTEAFKQSSLGALIAVGGADLLQKMAVPPQVTVVGVIALAAAVNLVIGSASAKWALLGPIFVPMLMRLGLSPELTQAAYRVGDSTTNVVTPLMPYFPLVVVYCRRHFTGSGIGTLVSMMIPYTAVFFVCWVLFLLAYWALGLPLGLQAPYTYP